MTTRATQLVLTLVVTPRDDALGSESELLDAAAAGVRAVEVAASFVRSHVGRGEVCTLLAGVKAIRPPVKRKVE